MKAADNRLSSISRWFSDDLSSIYSDREARNIAVIVIEELLNLSRSEQIIRADERLSESDILKLQRIKKRLLNSEPLQYVLGKTQFYELELLVNPDVLIPRVETEELVDKILKQHQGSNLRVLDIGTGSGCIALALKSNRSSWNLNAWDVSVKALEIARKNAEINELELSFDQVDILEHSPELEMWDIIVSNPPYIPHNESKTMPDLVLKNEPSIALFCPDDDPMLFYKKIIGYAESTLSASGELWFEIHENLGPELMALFSPSIWEAPSTFKDLQEKDRIVSARKLRRSI